MLQELVPKSVICLKAREYLGTPFLHQGRVKNKGIDCVGLIVEIGKELGILSPEQDYIHYSNRPDGTLIPRLRERFKEKPASCASPGDILVFAIRRTPSHLGIKTICGMIHTNMESNKVVENPIGQMWSKRLFTAFEYRNVI